MKHNLLVGYCPQDLWPKDFKPTPYVRKRPTGAEQAVTTPPPLLKQVKTFAQSMGRWAKDGFRLTIRPEHEYRMAICRKCPYFDAQGWAGAGKCLKCGCVLTAKTKIASQKCPIGKW